ncbi:Thiol-disulfide oxidoreductase ResA [Rubripirellula lacrimiformis]|uniref:Thiol-disulfide oxidoreductase ResA n=1 Tax=Rubripirellula lacrimiformis TaxID=1930273 RepID=A0A517N8S4_9BACT|nr:redoxin family protein [Rubripirellula lacrimiformis]QDT03550.1 Thiol-disulfide oxidoreductase ResA [Rubripirellula lacrimiformis]
MSYRFTIAVLSLALCWSIRPAVGQEETSAAVPDQVQGDVATGDGLTEVSLSGDLKSVLQPLFESISKADVSRATVEMLADSVLNGETVNSETSTFQIASRVPNQFTVYLKQPEQRTRVYCDGESFIAAMAPDAYFRMPEVISIQDAITNLPIPMGPYPEPLLSLTMAGADPTISLVAGMKSLDLIDRNPFRGKVPAVHVRGEQSDGVTWELWVTDEESPRPLRMLIDMTPMLIASDQVHVPDGFSYQVRYDFLTWRMSGDVDAALFAFTPADDATQYESLDDYFQSIAGATKEHPLLGQTAPRFLAITSEGKNFNSQSLKGRVIVLDFWATWCTPCVAAMPVIKKVTDRFADQGVVMVAVNTGQEREEVIEFLKEQKLKLNVVLDPEGKIADGFVVDAIPQTILIGKDGIIEAVHVGFDGDADLETRLTDELEVLSIGGKLGSATNPNEADSSNEK